MFITTVTFLNKEFSILILGRTLPEQAIVKAIVGRDILNKFKVCFDGTKKEVDISY